MDEREILQRAKNKLSSVCKPYCWVLADDVAYYRVAQELGFYMLPSVEEVKTLIRSGKPVPPVLSPYPPDEDVAGLFAVVVLPPAMGNITLQDFMHSGNDSLEELMSNDDWMRVVANRLKVGIYRPSLTLSDLIGAEKLKRLVERIKASQSDEKLKYKGVVLVGVPGTGKSYSAKCVAGELGRWLVEMSLGYLIEQPKPVYLLRQIFAYLEQAEIPVLLWIDEIEKAIGDDSPEVRRMVGELLKILNDMGTETGYRIDCIFWMTANRIEIVQSRYPELLRKGRVDVVLFVNTPKRSDVFELFRYYLSKYGIVENADDALLRRVVGIVDDVWKKTVKEKAARDVVADRHFYTPAEVEQVCKEIAREMKVSEVTFDEAVRTAAEGVYPIVVSMRDEISRMRGQKEAWEEL